MKTIKRIIIFSFVLFLGVQIANSQNLTYNELFKLSKIEQWSSIDKFLSSKKYKFAGSIDRKDHKTIAWTYNCTEFTFEDESVYYEFDHGQNRSIIYIQEYNDKYRTYLYILPSKETYSLFLRTAKNNGFVFHKDGFKEDQIFEIYKRNNEWLTFIKYKNGSSAIFYEP